MRIVVIAAAVYHSIVGVATADNAEASARKFTHIDAQDLGSALKQLAQSRGLQVLYLSTTVRDVRTRDVTLSEGAGASLQVPGGKAATANSRAQQAKNPGSDRILLAQGVPGSAHLARATSTDSQPLQEIVVTGSRIAAPNEVSTSPIQVISARVIQSSGKTDISDILNQLPPMFANDLGQDLGNGTSGLSSAGGVSTADLRGLGPGRTLVLIDGRRLGAGSPNTAIAQPAPDLDQIPVGLVDRIEVVTGGASAAYGSDAIAGVVNFILKRNFEGFQIDGQIGEYWVWYGNSATSRPRVRCGTEATARSTC